MWVVPSTCVDSVRKKHDNTRNIGPTMALGLTQNLTEMSTRNFCWGFKAAGVEG